MNIVSSPERIVHTLAQHEITEKIHDGDSTVIYRALNTETGQPVVLKFLKSSYPGNELLSKFEQEYSIAASFQSEQIVKAHSLEKYQNSLVIVFEDCGLITLASIINTGKKNVAWALDMAIKMTMALMEIHRNGVIHQDFNPSHIVYNSETDSIKVGGFGKAKIHSDGDISGTAPPSATTIRPYISPEQSGGHSRNLDYRTDLYSLGITIYHLFTGKLPFISADPMELIHLHLATPPVPPCLVDPNIPETLSNIVLKLIRKSRRPRYQTCAGLLADLHRCKQELQTNQTISKFTLGKNDLPGKLIFPVTLLSRQVPLASLHNAVQEKKGTALSVTVVTGHSGIGKTTLVHEFKNSLPPDSFQFTSGGYDLSASNKPYVAFTEVLQTLVNSVLVKNKQSVLEWKNKITEILQENGQLLIDITPDLEVIIGKQPPPLPLSPHETEQRLSCLYADFIQLFAKENKPLIIFLDDIHRANQSCLKLIERLTTSTKLCYLSFIFCCRDDEVNENHPLSATLSSIKKAIDHNFTTIKLSPLKHNYVTKLLAIMLSQPEEKVADLANICWKKTGGNPFLLKQFTRSLKRKNYLQFNLARGKWDWDIQAVHRAKLTKNITDFLIQRIQTLPEKTALLLENAACIGKSFTIDTLEAIVDCSPAETRFHLQELFSAGLLIIDEKPGEPQNHSQPVFFCHDQIQQAAYSLLTQKEIENIHLKIGQHLQKTKSPGKKNRFDFDVVHHLNRGSAYINCPSQRLELAEANLKAGKQAHGTASYDTAQLFFQTGLQLLPKKSWQNHYNLTLELHTEACDGAHLNNEYDEMERLFARVCSKASSLLDKTRVYQIKIRAQKSNYMLTEAVKTCEEVLKLLGVTFPRYPSRIFALIKLIETRVYMSRWTIDKLLNLPAMKDPYKKLAMQFLVEMGTSVYYAKPQLLPFVALKAVQLSLQHGNTTFAGQLAYPTYGFLLCGTPGGNITKGYDFGQLALNLQKKIRPKGVDPATNYVVNNLIVHWQDHIHDTLSPLLSASKKCTENGDFEIAANAAYSYSYRLYYLGYNLNRTEEKLDFYRREIAKHEQPIALYRQNIYCQAVANLLAKGDHPERLQGDYYREKEMIPLHESSGDQTTLFQLYLVKMIHCFLFSQYDTALTCSNLARKRLQSVLSSVFVPIYHFYDSLIRLALYENSPRKIRTQHRLRIGINQRKMKTWARHSPQNYQHKYNLVEAERARIKDHCIQALNMYDSAIDLARTSGYLQEEALAFELASRFYTSLNKPHLARPYMREARYCYYRWGAIAKVNHLDQQKHEKLHDATTRHISPEIIPPAFTPREGRSRLDMATVIKASRILTEETTFNELLKKILQIMMEGSGAQGGALIFYENGHWYLKIAGSTTNNQLELLDNIELDSQTRISAAIVNYVIQTKNELILHDATREGMFTDDKYIIDKSPRSIFCAPLSHQKKVECMLYLENNLMTRAFSAERQEMLRLLGNQAAISLRNARLFGELEASVAELHLEIEKRKKVQTQLLHSEKLSALGRLSSSIVHEFGNPLMGIRYLLHDFMERPDLGSKDHKLLHLGMEECNRMKELLRGMGQLNRPTTGRKSLANIHKLMDNVLFIQKKYLQSQKLKIEKNYTENLPDIFVIQDQISQVFLNLIINAADATSKGGGTVTVTTWLTENDQFLSIADTGKGIDMDIQDNIFEPFFSTKEEDGTGLGLSTSYGIIRKHNGQLSFISHPGQGTTFTISLPLTTPAQ